MVGSASGLTNFNTNEMGILSVNKPILYTIGCRKCNILKEKLTKKNVDFDTHTDTDEMIALGFDRMPVLVVDGKAMNFDEAVAWLQKI